MFSNKHDIESILHTIDLLEEYISDQNGEFVVEKQTKKERTYTYFFLSETFFVLSFAAFFPLLLP